MSDFTIWRKTNVYPTPVGKVDLAKWVEEKNATVMNHKQLRLLSAIRCLELNLQCGYVAWTLVNEMERR